MTIVVTESLSCCESIASLRCCSALTGVMRVGAHDLFATMGHEAIADESGPLPPIRAAHLGGEPTLIMKLRALGEDRLAARERWRGIWDCREQIGAS